MAFAQLLGMSDNLSFNLDRRGVPKRSQVRCPMDHC